MEPGNRQLVFARQAGQWNAASVVKGAAVEWCACHTGQCVFTKIVFSRREKHVLNKIECSKWYQSIFSSFHISISVLSKMMFSRRQKHVLDIIANALQPSSLTHTRRSAALCSWLCKRLSPPKLSGGSLELSSPLPSFERSCLCSGQSPALLPGHNSTRILQPGSLELARSSPALWMAGQQKVTSPCFVLFFVIIAHKMYLELPEPRLCVWVVLLSVDHKSRMKSE